jgi:hypothetical protein
VKLPTLHQLSYSMWEVVMLLLHKHRCGTKSWAYRWCKARVVLTSNDPEFSEKLHHIQSILSGLKADEAFFSIDEFGPFAVKAQPDRALVGPNEKRLVPQWRRSKGSLILTAAVELSSNQITHFYSTQKEHCRDDSYGAGARCSIR